METVIVEADGKVYTTTIVNKQEELNMRISAVELELSIVVEPTDAELIDEGRITHPHYSLVNELNELKGQICQ